MNSGIPWQVRGVRPEARDTAREAARRSGLSVGEWLNDVIISRAGEEGVASSGAGGTFDEHDLAPTAAGSRLDVDVGQVSSAVGPEFGEESQRVAEAIAQLNRRLDRLISDRRGPTAHYREQGPIHAISEDRDDLLDQAIAEITARQQTLDRAPTATPQSSIGAPQPTPPIAPPPAASPMRPADYAPSPTRRASPPGQTDVLPRPTTQGLGGLETQLRQVTTQIESLRGPELEAAIAALRRELGDVARALHEAMPRRSIEALEWEIRNLAERIDVTRGRGLDGDSLAALERGLFEMRDALRTLTPAENLNALHFTIESLARKIDTIASGNQDPRALQQLEEAIALLRGVASHVASNESLNQLADEMRALAANVDRVARSANNTEMLTDIDQRISSLAQTLEANRADGDEKLSSIDQRISFLAQTLESRVGGDEVLSNIDQRISSLAQTLESRAGGDEVLSNIDQRISSLAQTLESRAGGDEMLSNIDQRISSLAQTLEASQAGGDEKLSNIDRRISSLAQTLETSRVDGDEKLSNIDQRISSLAQTLEASRTGENEAPQFESVARSLTEKLEKLSLSRGDHAAVDALEDRIAKLVEKLDASGARLNHLEAIEHALAELLVHLEQQRAQGGGAPREAATQASAEVDVDLFKQDINEIKLFEQRTEDSLAAAHDTLGAVVDRLAMIETDLRGEAASDAPAPTPAPQPVERRPIDPTLPPDHPLEPGLGASPSRAAATPAARIAASEAALGRAKPPVIPDPGAKGDFIAAARRAAQAASLTAAADATPVRPETEPAEPDDEPNPPGGITRRVRLLFVGAAVVAVVGGSLYFTARMIGPMGEALITAAEPRITTTALAPAAFNDGPSASAPVHLSEPSIARSSGDITGSLQPADPAPSGDRLRPGVKTAELPDAFGPTLRTLAASGDGPAAFEVASRYAEGRGVPQNAEEAARWFERAAHQGLAPAKFRLGGMYEKGIGVKKNLETARRLYLAAAEAGSGKAMHNLAVLHAEGIDGKPDYRSALHWFRKGADHGVTDSQYNLGVLYARGIGVELNLTESFKWFALAARDGDREAARKRDEIGTRLEPQALATARLAVQNWMPQPEPRAAVEVPAPAGGWDGGAEQQPTPPAKRADSATGGPLRPLPASRRSSQ